MTDGQTELAGSGGESRRSDTRFAKLDELRFPWPAKFSETGGDAHGEVRPGREGSCCWKLRSHLRTVGTVVAKSRAAGLLPRCLALSTSRRRWL